MPDAVKTRRFPPPWVVEDHNNACFIVKDVNGFAVAYVSRHTGMSDTLCQN
jgi:hypothetical protein